MTRHDEILLIICPAPANTLPQSHSSHDDSPLYCGAWSQDEVQGLDAFVFRFKKIKCFVAIVDGEKKETPP